MARLAVQGQRKSLFGEVADRSEGDGLELFHGAQVLAQTQTQGNAWTMNISSMCKRSLRKTKVAARRVWFWSFGAFLTVTWRVTFAIGSWLGSWAMNLKAAAQRHGKMDAGGYKKLGRFFVCDMVEIPAKRRKSCLRPSSATRRKTKKMPPEFIRGQVVVQGVEGSNPFSHPTFSQRNQSLKRSDPSNRTGAARLGSFWDPLLLGFRSGLVPFSPEIPAPSPCQGSAPPTSISSRNGVTALTSVWAYRSGVSIRR